MTNYEIKCPVCDSKNLDYVEARTVGYEQKKHQGKSALVCNECNTVVKLV